MPKQRPFRFGLNGINSASRDEWGVTARKAEDLGYSTLCVGERFHELELNILILAVIVANEAREAAEELVRQWQWNLNLDGIGLADLLESPHFLFGTEDEMVEALQRRRARYGISYFTILGEEYIDAFAPILARLVGM